MGAGVILIMNSATHLSGLGWDYSKDNFVYAAIAFCFYYTIAEACRLLYALISYTKDADSQKKGTN